jgi:Flp pilus assembly protein TadG
VIPPGAPAPGGIEHSDLAMSKRLGEKGAAAVEFALILPVFVLLIVGMLEFSRAYNAQISISNAAREGARVMAIHDDAATAKAAAIAAGVSLNPALSSGDIAITPASCDGAANGTVEVSIDYDLPLMTGFFGITLPISGVGVMLCGG